MSEHSCWALLRTHGKLPSDFTNMALYTFEQARIWPFKAILKQPIPQKCAKMRSTPNIIDTQPYSIDCTQSKISNFSPAHRRMNLDFILSDSGVTAQIR